MVQRQCTITVAESKLQKNPVYDEDFIPVDDEDFNPVYDEDYGAQIISLECNIKDAFRDLYQMDIGRAHSISIGKEILQCYFQELDKVLYFDVDSLPLYFEITTFDPSKVEEILAAPFIEQASISPLQKKLIQNPVLFHHLNIDIYFFIRSRKIKLKLRRMAVFVQIQPLFKRL